MSKVSLEKIIQLQLTHMFVMMLLLHRAPAKGRSCDFKLYKLLIFCIVWTFAIRSVFQLIKIGQLLNIFYIQGSEQTLGDTSQVPPVKCNHMQPLSSL